MYVWILFEDQKNKQRSGSHSQRNIDNPLLCPVLRFGRAVQRIRRYTKKPTDDTPLCSVNISGRRSKFITQENTLLFIRKTCFYHGGKTRFGFHPHEIGNKSVRSGAAMALFLKHHSTDKIMLLGRWKSKAFMVYIRPQVVEWAECFSGHDIL